MPIVIIVCYYYCYSILLTTDYQLSAIHYNIYPSSWCHKLHFPNIYNEVAVNKSDSLIVSYTIYN